MSTGAPAPQAVSGYARRSARAAHLFGIGNVVFTFVGLIAAIAIFRINRNEPFVRANARCAVNMQITWLLFVAIVVTVYLVMFFGHGSIVRAGDVETGRLLTQRRYWIALSLVGSILLSMIVTMILNVVGAITASRGRVYRYPLAIPFLRSSETPVS